VSTAVSAELVSPPALSPLATRVRWATVATLVTTLFIVAYLGSANWLSLVTPGLKGPSAAVFVQDFPDVEFPDAVGHDGQQVYAQARNAFNPAATAPYLDRPQYRWQRPLLPWLANALHPSGGGMGLVLALLFVNLIAVFIGAFCLSWLSQQVGGPGWAGVVLAALPGIWETIEISTSDALALCLAIAAIALCVSHRPWWAATVASLAVLGKESIGLVLAVTAVSLARSIPRALLSLLVFPAATGALWWLAVRVIVPADGQQVAEFGIPFRGVIESAQRWANGDDQRAMLIMAFAFIGGGIIAATHRHHVLTPVVLTQLAFLSLLNVNVVGLNANAPRSTLPAVTFAIVIAITPRWTRRRTTEVITPATVMLARTLTKPSR
jgi:hypothetical protein